MKKKLPHRQPRVAVKAVEWGKKSHTLKLTDGCETQECYYATMKQTMPKPKKFKCQEYNTKQPTCWDEKFKKKKIGK